MTSAVFEIFVFTMYVALCRLPAASTVIAEEDGREEEKTLFPSLQ